MAPETTVVMNGIAGGPVYRISNPCAAKPQSVATRTTVPRAIADAKAERPFRRRSASGSPRWRRDGKELFYLSLDNKIMAVPVETTPPVPSCLPITDEPSAAISAMGNPGSSRSATSIVA